MEPLSRIDAAFLALETATTPYHVGVALVLEQPDGSASTGQPPTRYAQIRRVVEQRLHLVPPLRQRAVKVPLGLHHPAWVDDPEFELDDHLSRASVPAPGGRAELDAFVASVMSRPLDPERPLWEMHVVEGLENGRTALVAKVHHAILDGVSGASALAAFLDVTPQARLVALPSEWNPDPLPSTTQMLRHAASSLAGQPAEALNTIQSGVETVSGLRSHNRELVGRGEHPPPSLFSAPRTSFNGAVSNRRRYAGLSVPLEDVQLVGSAFEATVNDVLLAAVAGGLRRLLAGRGEVSDAALVAMVPVSTRPEGTEDALGNQVSAMLVSLATDIDDPVDRLDAISESSRVAKEQERMHGGRLLGDLAQLALPALTSRVATCIGGDTTVRQGPASVQRHGVECEGARRPSLLRWREGRRDVPGRTHGRGRGAQRHGLLVSRACPVRVPLLSETPARGGSAGGARRRRAGRTGRPRPGHSQRLCLTRSVQSLRTSLNRRQVRGSACAR